MRDAKCTPKAIAKRSLAKQADLFKVLSDENRLKILAGIAGADDEVCVCDLNDGLPLEQPTVSHHLRVLRNAGLVTSSKRGTWVYYRLAPGALAAIHEAVDAVTGPAQRASLKRTG